MAPKANSSQEQPQPNQRIGSVPNSTSGKATQKTRSITQTNGPFTLAHSTGQHPLGGDVKSWTKAIKRRAHFYLTRGKKSGQGADFDQAAQAYLDYARATGRLDSYNHARTLLERADKLIKPATPIRLPWAAYKIAVHDFDGALQITETLARHTTVPGKSRRAILGLHGDALFNMGRFRDALAAYTAANQGKPSVAGYARIAHYKRATGDLAGAKRAYDNALKLPVPRYGPTWAWLLVMRGLLAFDYGDAQGAIPFYEQAVSALPGWYLSTEHLAEAYGEVGRIRDALTLYQLVLKTNPDPAFMDAISGLYVKLGQLQKSKSWARRARQTYATRLADYPALTTGHGLEYFLENGSKATALKLAKAYFKQRPAGDGAVKYVQALMVVGQLSDAHAQLKPILASPYSTPGLHGTASLLFHRLGRMTMAEQHRKRAIDLNPMAMAELDWLRDVIARGRP
ncbi:MAG: tetratricopeptide repeat protein [Myxococcota bacterium]|nr:tetratricopeptide repeat protein [Myxococcota bacterium]